MYGIISVHVCSAPRSTHSSEALSSARDRGEWVVFIEQIEALGSPANTEDGRNTLPISWFPNLTRAYGNNGRRPR